MDSLNITLGLALAVEGSITTIPLVSILNNCVLQVVVFAFTPEIDAWPGAGIIAIRLIEAVATEDNSGAVVFFTG